MTMHTVVPFWAFVCMVPEALGLLERSLTMALNILPKDSLWNVSATLPTDAVDVHDAMGKKVGVILVRGLTGDEVTKYQDSLTVKLSSGGTRPNIKYAMAKLIVMAAVNEDGSPYFDQSETAKLDQSPSRILMPLFEAAQRLSGLTEDDVKEMTEGFEETQSDGSDSGSL